MGVEARPWRYLGYKKLVSQAISKAQEIKVCEILGGIAHTILFLFRNIELIWNIERNMVMGILGRGDIM